MLRSCWISLARTNCCEIAAHAARIIGKWNGDRYECALWRNDSINLKRANYDRPGIGNRRIRVVGGS
jgi:hypothetical protein